MSLKQFCIPWLSNRKLHSIVNVIVFFESVCNFSQFKSFSILSIPRISSTCVKTVKLLKLSETLSRTGHSALIPHTENHLSNQERGFAAADHSTQTLCEHCCQLVFLSALRFIRHNEENRFYFPQKLAAVSLPQCLSVRDINMGNRVKNLLCLSFWIHN